MRFNWKHQTQPYQNGIDCYLNKVKIASVFWDGGSPPVNEAGEKLHYKTSIFLPQVNNVGSFLTQKEATKAVENSVINWFKHVTRED